MAAAAGGAALAAQRRRRGKGVPEGGRPPATEEEPACGQERTASPSSPHEAADKRPFKRLKYEKSSPVKSELEELPRESQNPAALGETPETSDGDERSEGPGDHSVTEQKKGESIPEAKEAKQEKEQNVSLEPCAAKSSGAPPKMDSAEDLQSGACSEEESSGGSVHSDRSSSQEAALPKKPVQPDHSAFLNEDSNQPMPVDRFFGDVGFLQDVPAAAHPMTAASRREFRKLHFIAKEEEEEEEEDVVQQQTVNK